MKSDEKGKRNGRVRCDRRDGNEFVLFCERLKSPTHLRSREMDLVRRWSIVYR